MIVFPNCKINLGLHITGKRADGYHNLETVFIPLNFTDVLEIVRKENKDPEIDLSVPLHFTSSGIASTLEPESNICYKAWQLLHTDFSAQLPPVAMHLHKVIPTGAGLGGGSADGAFTLQLINQKFNLGLSNEQLSGYALRLGSDCPFFIHNRPAYATGRGELLEPIELDLSAYNFLLVNPGIHIPTGPAFSSLTPALPMISIRDIIRQPIITWKSLLINDFEKPVFAEYPEIRDIRDALYTAGALYASLSGSGSSVYGVFEKKQPINCSFPAHYFTRELTML